MPDCRAAEADRGEPLLIDAAALERSAHIRGAARIDDSEPDDTADPSESEQKKNGQPAARARAARG